MGISFFNTALDPSAIEEVSKTLQSGFLNEGPRVEEFQKKLSADLGWIHPNCLNSGTSALHLCMLLADIGPGDEVIVPAQTFIATALAVKYVGATPVFADINYDDGNIDPKSVQEKITSRTKAILPVHWAGYPCDLDALQAIADKHNLFVIEDAAHAPGAEYKGRPVGAISDMTCFSFQAIKHLTTGDGGAVCVLDEALAQKALRLRWFGIDRGEARKSAPLVGGRSWLVEELGYKYHMNDVAASLGLANLRSFPKHLARRRQNAKFYADALKGIAGLQTFKYAGDRLSSYWVYGVHVERREDFARALKSRGVPASVVDFRIDRNPVLGGLTPSLHQQEAFEKTQIHLPIHEALSDQDLVSIVEAIKAGW